MPTYKLKAPRRFGDIPEGYEIQVSSNLTGNEPSGAEVEREIKRLGFNSEAQSYRAAGNWIVTKN